MDATTYQDYVNILHEELVPAMGCTEPIAIAYAAAVARQTLGRPAQRMEVEASGNIIKNVKSVFVPNTGGLRGIPAAAAAGMAAGDPALELEVLSSIGEGEQAAIRQYLADTPIAVKLADSPFIFDIAIRAWAEEDSALVRIVNYHTNIVRVERNGQVLKEVEAQAAAEEGLTDKSVLTVEGILEFAREAALADVEDAVGRQVRYNTAIAQEGLRGDYGANIGKVLLATYGDDVKIRAKAMAAAGSDARMNGCGLPVVIVSGSGNQGLTASLPVVEYAKELGADWETTLRAVLVSDLVTIHLKAEIGRLSAYCGAVSAGCGSGAGIAWLYGREKEPQALLKDVLPHHRQRPGGGFRHCVRRGQGLLRGENRLRRGRGAAGLLHVPERPAVPGRGRHHLQGRGGDHPQHWPAGHPGHAGDRPGNPGHHDHPLLTFL